MKPDKKYMSEYSSASDKIHFTPPEFSNKFRQSNMSDSSQTENNPSLNLYPSETEGEFLYCYYSSFGDCEFNNLANKNLPINYKTRIPTPSEVLENLDYNFDEIYSSNRDENNNNVEEIYASIEQDNPGILTTLASYMIPYPISKIMIKKIIKLTLSYCEKEGD